MLKNYFKIALRNILRNKIFTIINVGGLAIALAASFFILIFVVNEFSYDKYNIKRDRIYRVITNKTKFNISRATAPYILKPTLLKNLPEIENVTRVGKLKNVNLKYLDNFFDENKFMCTDPDIFKILTLPLIAGSNKIDGKLSIVISEDIARKYFGTENPVNKILNAKIIEQEFLFKVVGVMKNIPHNSTFRADIIGNIQLRLEQIQKGITYSNVATDWNMDWWATYVLLKRNVTATQLKEKFRKLEKQYLPEYIKDHYGLQKLNDAYLHSAGIVDLMPQGNLGNIYLYLTIGIIILLIAGSNYIILSSALSGNRLKEIGIRKVIGATKQNIVFQVLSESLLLTFLSFAIAVIIVEMAKPYAQSLFNYKFYFLSSNIFYYGLGFLIITVLIGIFSGAYLAFYLSSFEVVDIIKNRLFTRNNSYVKRGLIVFQLVIFSILVFSSIIIYKQYIYAQNKDLGFNKENIIIINFDYNEFTNYKVFLNTIRSNPNIINAASAFLSLPTNSSSVILMKLFSNPNKKIRIKSLSVSFNFIETFGLHIVKGRSFSKNFPSDKTKGIILNETAIKELGIKNPIGKEIEGRKIIGIVKDFNMASLHSKIKPLMMSISDGKFVQTIVIKYKNGTYKNTIDYLKKEWNKVAGEIPFTFQTFEDALSDLYEKEKTLLDIVFFFTILTIILAASGLFGLTLFTLQKRTKEIGIRKVLGASVGNLMTLLTKEFLFLMLVANIIAWPVAYYFMNKWLQNFAYKIGIGMLPFIVTTVIVIAISMGTIIIQTLKVALANPVESLRSE